MDEPKAPKLEKVVFKQALEALYLRALSGKLDPATVEKLKALGLNLHQPLMTAYAYATFQDCLRVTLTALYGPRPSVAQQREFGRVWTDGFFETFLGVALLGVLKLIGPRRAVLRSAQNYRNINNYANAKAVELAPNHFEVWLVDGADWPEVTVGSLARSIELTGAREVRVAHVRVEGEHNVYDAQWAL
jgi:uncharacterized protein (TIGR02265 family)